MDTVWLLHGRRSEHIIFIVVFALFGGFSNAKSVGIWDEAPMGELTALRGPVTRKVVRADHFWLPKLVRVAKRGPGISTCRKPFLAFRHLCRTYFYICRRMQYIIYQFESQFIIYMTEDHPDHERAIVACMRHTGPADGVASGSSRDPHLILP